MHDDHSDIDEEKPLDPEMEKVRRKMIRLLVVSLTIMFISIFAVLAGVFYKIKNGDDNGESDLVAQSESGSISALMAELTVSLPDRFQITSIDIDGDRVALFGQKMGSEATLLILDLSSGQIISEVEFVK